MENKIEEKIRKIHKCLKYKMIVAAIYKRDYTEEKR